MEAGRRRVGSRLDRQSLDEVGSAARGCRLCRLCDSRTHVVFGAGAEDARVMFVTEAPGYHEDRVALPFAGDAAELFGSLLEDAGLSHDDVYVTSVVKCRPPRNRSPFPDEIESCEGYLFREVTLVQPQIVCALGNVPIRLLTGKPHRLSEVHGQPVPVAVQGRDVLVYPLYHPAAAVHVPALIAELRTDVRRIPALLRSGADAWRPAGAGVPQLSEELATTSDLTPGSEQVRAEEASAGMTQLALDIG